MSKNVELANDEISVKSVTSTKINITKVMTTKLTQGMSFVRSRKENMRGRALSWAITIPNRVVPNSVALMAEAVESNAPRPIKTNPACPRNGLAGHPRRKPQNEKNSAAYHTSNPHSHEFF